MLANLSIVFFIFVVMLMSATVKAYIVSLSPHYQRCLALKGGLRSSFMPPFSRRAELHTVPNKKLHNINGMIVHCAARGFGSTSSSGNDNASKQQKLQELISAYQQASQTGPIDRTTLKTALDGSESTSPPGTKKVFDETMKFPTDFMIKIVGQNEPTFVSDMLAAVAKCLDQTKKQDFPYSIKETAGGKYISLTVKPLFQNSDELYATYAAIGQDKRVKLTL